MSITLRAHLGPPIPRPEGIDDCGFCGAYLPRAERLLTGEKRRVTVHLLCIDPPDGSAPWSVVVCAECGAALERGRDRDD